MVIALVIASRPAFDSPVPDDLSGGELEETGSTGPGLECEHRDIRR